MQDDDSMCREKVAYVAFSFYGYFIHHNMSSIFTSLFKTSAGSTFDDGEEPGSPVVDHIELSDLTIIVCVQDRTSIQSDCLIRDVDACLN